MSVPSSPGPSVPTCPRHPDRESRIRCQRCGRPACPECQRPAAVGVHCVDCVRESARSAPQRRTPTGAVATTGRPVVTLTVIGVCVLVYLGQLLSPAVTSAGYFSPALGLSEPWRFLTAAFLHAPGQPLHILFNMMCLWAMGQWLEPMFGRGRFVALYLLAGLGGSVGYLLLASPPQSPLDLYGSAWVTPTLGASGAVFGLFGAALILLRHLGRSLGGMVVLLAINAVFPLFYPNIAWQAHLGGFVTGLLAAGALIALRSRPQAQWAALAGVLVLVVGIAVARYALADLTFLDGLAPF